MAAAQTCNQRCIYGRRRVHAKTFRRATKYLMVAWKGGSFFLLIDRPHIFVAPLIPSRTKRGRGRFVRPVVVVVVARFNRGPD